MFTSKLPSAALIWKCRNDPIIKFSLSFLKVCKNLLFTRQTCKKKPFSIRWTHWLHAIRSRPRRKLGLYLHLAWIQPECVTSGTLNTILSWSQCVWRIFSEDTNWRNSVLLWDPLKQSSPLVMWVNCRTRPIIPSLVSPSFTSQWTGINATPLLGFLHEQNESMRTEMVLEE